MRCSPTMLLHTKGSRELSFTQLPKPPPCEVFSYPSITYKGEQGAIIHPSPPNPHPVRCSPTLLLHNNRSRELSFTQVPTPSPCEVFSYHAIIYSRELSFTKRDHAIIYQRGSYHSPKSPPSPCEVFSYHAITYQREQGAIIHPSPHNLTL